MSAFLTIMPVLDGPSCRFCGSTTTCRLGESPGSLGRQEVYSGMIKSCFGIEVSHCDDPAESMMCSLCVNQLQQAINFKIQIMQGEQANEQKINCDRTGLELQGISTFVDEGWDKEMSDGLDDKLDETLLRQYHMLGNMVWNLTHKIGYKPSPPSLSSTAFIPPLTVYGGDASDSNCSQSDDCRRIIPNKYNVALDKEMKRKPGKCLDGRDQPFMQAANSAAIVKYSFVCPFKTRFNHIMCYYCNEYFLNPDLLREHTMSHDVKAFRPARHGYTKVDITRIDCRLCLQKINNLKDLRCHLASHGKKYFFSSIDRILPFKLVENVNKCVVCEEQFSYFCGLYIHMSQHFSNCMCETCGVGFMDALSLQKHRTAHDGKRYTCIECGKSFKTEYSRLLHAKRVHEESAGTYCNKCDGFLCLDEKAEHMAEVHGDSTTVPCVGCDKVFKSRRQLTIHVRREHMKDYRYECQFCHKKFFTKSSLTLHLPTHTGERNFKCKVCEKSYPRLKTLKEHMRIHNNDRRYRCHVCGQAFIQNCSLKGHLKNKHPESG